MAGLADAVIESMRADLIRGELLDRGLKLRTRGVGGREVVAVVGLVSVCLVIAGRVVSVGLVAVGLIIVVVAGLITVVVGIAVVLVVVAGVVVVEILLKVIRDRGIVSCENRVGFRRRFFSPLLCDVGIPVLLLEIP